MADLIIGRNACLEALKGGRKIHSITILEPGKGKAQARSGRSADRGSDRSRSKQGGRPNQHGPIDKIVIEAERRGIEIRYTDRKTMDRMADGVVHQGVIATAEEYAYSSLEDIVAFAEEKGEPPFLIILDGIEDPHNLGAIMRTAECAGAHGVIIPKNRSASVNETVLKTSAGAAEYIRCAQVTNIARTMEDLKEKGVWIYACDMGDSDIWQTDLTGSVAIVIGSEGKGVSRLVRENADGIISLPMSGKVGSLNASNAAAVAIYEVVRQRKGNG